MTGGRAAAALVLLLALAAPAAAQVERLDLEGAVAVSEGEEGSAALRRAALADAVRRAVDRVALELLAEGSGVVESPDRAGLRAVLGADRGAYTARFQIARVRGVRAPVLLAADPRAEAEYAVLAQVWVDRDAVRARLEESGVLVVEREPSGGGGGGYGRLFVVLDPATYSGYQLVREQLEGVPVELEPGRVVLEVPGNGDPYAALRRLRRAAPEGVRVEGSERGGVLHLQVTGEPLPEDPSELTP